MRVERVIRVIKRLLGQIDAARTGAARANDTKLPQPSTGR